MHISFLKKKKKNVEWICGDGIAEIGGKKKLLQLVCGNGIAEIEGEKIVGMNLWQWHCRNRRKKKIVAIGLWQWHCRNRRKRKKILFDFGNGIAEIGNWRREGALFEYIYIYKGHIFLFFHSFLDLFCVYVMFLPFAMKSQSTYQPITSNSSSDSYSLLGFILRLNLPKSISNILFCLFISPLHNKRQVTSSQSYILAEELHLLTTPIVHLLICFASMCTTKDYKFFVNVTFFALLIN